MKLKKHSSARSQTARYGVGSWAWVSTIPSCSEVHISLEVLTSQSDSIILYSGSESSEDLLHYGENNKPEIIQKNKNDRNTNSSEISKRGTIYLNQQNTSSIFNLSGDINSVFGNSASFISDNYHNFFYALPHINKSDENFNYNNNNESSSLNFSKSNHFLSKTRNSKLYFLVHSKSKRRQRRKRTRLLDRNKELYLKEKRNKQKYLNLSSKPTKNKKEKYFDKDNKLEILSFRKRINELKMTDMILLELQNGYPKLSLDLGSGQVVLNINTTSSLADNKWHRFDITWKDNVSILLLFCI